MEANDLFLDYESNMNSFEDPSLSYKPLGRIGVWMEFVMLLNTISYVHILHKCQFLNVWICDLITSFKVYLDSPIKHKRLNLWCENIIWALDSSIKVYFYLGEVWLLDLWFKYIIWVLDSPFKVCYDIMEGWFFNLGFGYIMVGFHQRSCVIIELTSDFSIQGLFGPIKAYHDQFQL